MVMLLLCSSAERCANPHKTFTMLLPAATAAAGWTWLSAVESPAVEESCWCAG
jgi:hypothetical protein